MKTIKIVMLVALIGFCGGTASAQLTDKQEKQIAKEAKKEAKRLKKEGWSVPAGNLPLEMQLAQAYKLQAEVNNDMQPKYIFGQAISGGSFYDAAKMQAVELAKAELASNILTDLTTIVNVKLENRQIIADQATSASEIIKEGEAVVSQQLVSPIPLVEIYRTLKDGTVEVQIRFAYEKEKGLKTGINALSTEFEKEGVDL